jgi:hypothetical protein
MASGVGVGQWSNLGAQYAAVTLIYRQGQSLVLVADPESFL